MSDILLLTIYTAIPDAEGWKDTESFGETHLDFSKQYGDFEDGVPVHDTIARVVSQGKITQRYLLVLSNLHFVFKNRDIPYYLKLLFIAYT